MNTFISAPPRRTLSRRAILPPEPVASSTRRTLGLVREERLHLDELARPPHRRQAVEERSPVRSGDHAWIAEHQHAPVGLVTVQAPSALLERDRGLRQLEVEEVVVAGV